MHVTREEYKVRHTVGNLCPGTPTLPLFVPETGRSSGSILCLSVKCYTTLFSIWTLVCLVTCSRLLPPCGVGRTFSLSFLYSDSVLRTVSLTFLTLFREVVLFRSTRSLISFKTHHPLVSTPRRSLRSPPYPSWEECRGGPFHWMWRRRPFRYSFCSGRPFDVVDTCRNPTPNSDFNLKFRLLRE